MTVGILVNRWFESSRGLAAGIAFAGSGIIAAILVPFCNYVIERRGIASGYLMLPIALIVLSLPVLIFIVRDYPKELGLCPYKKHSSKFDGSEDIRNSAEDVGITREKAFRMPSYWFVFAAVAGIAICQASPNTNTVSILADIGYPASFGATIASVNMVLLTLCKIGIGRVFDKAGSYLGSMIIGVSCILFPLIALFNQVNFVPWIYIFFLAIATSGSSVLGNFLTADYFGTKDYDRLYSVIALATQLGAAISSPIFGRIYDLTGGYTKAWLIVSGLGAVVCVLLTAAYKTAHKGTR